MSEAEQLQDTDAIYWINEVTLLPIGEAAQLVEMDERIGYVASAIANRTLDLATDPATSQGEAAKVLHMYEQISRHVPIEDASMKETSFEDTLSDFLNPDVNLDIHKQFALMEEFWGKLGEVVPKLSGEQMYTIKDMLEKNPGKRIVPTPHKPRPLETRRQMVERAREVFPKQQFIDNKDIFALSSPTKSESYGQSLVDPEIVLYSRDYEYAKLGYKTRDGEVVNRAGYLESLANSGDAIESDDGTIWTFLLIDAHEYSPIIRQRAKNLLLQVSYLDSPESLIVEQLLNHANGTPNSELVVYFANEAIYKSDSNGKYIKGINGNAFVLSVASVYWDPDFSRIRLCDNYADSTHDNYGRSKAVTSL